MGQQTYEPILLPTSGGAAGVVGEVGNGPNKCNWVENSATHARHGGCLHSRDVSAQYNVHLVRLLAELFLNATY
jgi:hypothetical protein